MNTNPLVANEAATTETQTVLAPATYEAPAIESVVTFEDLQREVLYAGVSNSGNPPVPA